MTSLSCLSVLVLALTLGWSHQQQVWPGGMANCNYELDVVFAIDGSNSMFASNFEQEKAALSNLVNSLNVSPRDINVGVVSYSSVVQSYPLSGNKAAVVGNIASLGFPDEATRTDIAISRAHAILNDGRGGSVRKMLIIITDGRSTDPARTFTEAESAKRDGIAIYAVGVTDAIKESELRTIASSPQFVYHSENFQTLRQVLLSATNEACITTPPTPGPKALDCTDQLDIIIALDGSNSMFPNNFQTEKAAIANMISRLELTQDGLHVGLVLFSGDVQSYPLSGNSRQVIANLNNFGYPDDATRTDLAIEKASELFRSARGGTVQKVLVIVTDGRATFPDRTQRAADSIKATGVNVFALGVTDAINQRELRALASSPQYVLFSRNYDAIRTDLLRLTTAVCEQVTQPPTRPPPTAPIACTFQLDLLIAFDGSNSMFEDNFNIQKAAIANLVRNLNVGPNDIRVGLILFSGTVTSEALSGNKQQIINAVNALQYPDDTTRTDLAIQEAMNLFTTARANVPKLLIIITDGRATYPQQTLTTAQAAKNSGIGITCVGVTDAINRQELLSLASSPRHVFLSADFQSLQRDIIQATNEACEAAATTAPPVTRIICNDHLDLVVAIDGSNSINRQNFELVKSSVTNMISSLNVSPQDIYVGLVLFSGSVTSRPLTGNKQQIIRDVNGFSYPDDGTRTDLAIEEATRLLAQSRGGNVRKLLIVITDGRATFHDRALQAAQTAKSNGINIYAVGVTGAIDQQELRDLASTQSNVLFSNNFRSLQADLVKATNRACYTITN